MMKHRRIIQFLVPACLVLLGETQTSAVTQPWNLNGTWKIVGPVFNYRDDTNKCTVFDKLPPYQGSHQIVQTGNQIRIDGFPGQGVVQGNTLQYTVAAKPRRELTGRIVEQTNPQTGAVVTTITGTAVCEKQATIQFTMTRTQTKPVGSEGSNQPSTNSATNPSPGSISEIRAAVPADTPLTFAIAEADETALIYLNGQLLVTAEWNGQPGTANRSIPLKPGVYDLSFVIASRRPSCSGLFTLSLAGQPLTSQPIGKPQGSVRAQQSTRSPACFSASTKLILTTSP